MKVTPLGLKNKSDRTLHVCVYPDTIHVRIATLNQAIVRLLIFSLTFYELMINRAFQL